MKFYKKSIKHFNLKSKEEIITDNFLPRNTPVKIILTSGASCPDAIVDQVLKKILTFFPEAKNIKEVLREIFKKLIIETQKYASL